MTARRGKADVENEQTDKPHRGSTLDSFLEEEGVLAETRAKAIEEVVAWRRANPTRKTRRFSKGG